MVPSHPSLPLSVPSLYFALLQHFWGGWGWFYEPGHILSDGAIEASKQHACCKWLCNRVGEQTHRYFPSMSTLTVLFPNWVLGTKCCQRVEKWEREGTGCLSSCLGHTEAAALPHIDKAISPTPYWQSQPPYPPHLHNILELALAWKSGELGSCPSP